MSIGETLARARREAGLSIAEISSQTRIRLSVIDDIEHDNYAACGGDHRARGTIVAIAVALGVDAEPLLEEYEAARRPAGWIVASQACQELAPGDEPAPVPTDEDTQEITIGQPSVPTVVDEPIIPAGTALLGEEFWASGPVRPVIGDRRPLLWIALGAALLAAAALGGILLIVGTTGQAARHAVADGRHHIGGRAGARPTRTQPPSPRHSVSSPGQIRSASHRNSRPGQALAPASITAFGPGGTGQGDSPELAHQALAGEAAAPWHSAWYTTSHFGNLQSGTGLLLDMGRSVTITSVRISLGNRSGADVAVRIGSSPSLATLPPVARANGVGGVVRLKTAPTRGRYVLVWFTRLPPDQAGTFQASVYDIKLRGHP